MEIINYIFYRLYKHYTKEFPVFTASIYISALEIGLIYFAFMMYNAIFYPKKILAQEIIYKYGINQNEGKLYVVIFCIILHLANYFYYRNRITLYESKFSNYPLNKWFKLWMLYLIGLFLFLFPILIFKLRQ